MREEDLPEDFKARVADARALTEYEDRIEPRAVRAWYDAERKLIMFELKNGCLFGFPSRELADWGLAGATPEQLAQVEADEGGSVLYWEPLEEGIVIPGLLLRLLNVKAWCWKWFSDETTEGDAVAGHAEHGRALGQSVEHVGD